MNYQNNNQMPLPNNLQPFRITSKFCNLNRPVMNQPPFNYNNQQSSINNAVSTCGWSDPSRTLYNRELHAPSYSNSSRSFPTHPANANYSIGTSFRPSPQQSTTVPHNYRRNTFQRDISAVENTSNISFSNTTSNGIFTDNTIVLNQQVNVKKELKIEGSIQDTAKKIQNDGGKQGGKGHILTGSAEKVIKWYRLFKNYFCFYEVIASLISIEEGNIPLQKILLLRDMRGPVLQVAYYVNDHIKINDFCSGKMLRCVGIMIGPNMLHAYSIREASEHELTSLQRMVYASEQALSKILPNYSTI